MVLRQHDRARQCEHSGVVFSVHALFFPPTVIPTETHYHPHAVYGPRVHTSLPKSLNFPPSGMPHVSGTYNFRRRILASVSLDSTPLVPRNLPSLVPSPVLAPVSNACAWLGRRWVYNLPPRLPGQYVVSAPVVVRGKGITGRGDATFRCGISVSPFPRCLRRDFSVWDISYPPSDVAWRGGTLTCDRFRCEVRRGSGQQ